MTMTLPRSIEIVEVGPRDGLQDEDVVATDVKIAYAEALIAAGVRRIEVASFVNPKRVPQMADSEEVVHRLSSHAESGVRLIGLVLNERGLDRALETALAEINIVVVVSDTFSNANQGMDSAAALAMARTVVGRATAAGLRTGVTLSAAFGCPYEGDVPADRVLGIAREVAAMGTHEVSLADTIGVAVPNQTEDLVAAVLADTGLPVRVHLHDSFGAGLANAVAALAGGATALDSSTGGLGGCPFAPGASGNVATENLVRMLERMGVSTGIDLAAINDAAQAIRDEIGARPTCA
jgi:hydroxymethylglutaryl-CoA lyase